MAEELIQQLKEASAHCEGGDSYNSRIMRKAARAIETLRAQLPSQGGEAVAEYQQLSRYGNWDRIDKVDFDLGMLGSCPDKFRTLYTHPADQVAEPDAKLVELLEAGRLAIIREIDKWSNAARAGLPVNVRKESELVARIDAKLAEVRKCQP